jgi:hypothetical protein
VQFVGVLVEQRGEGANVSIPRCAKQLTLQGKRIHVRFEHSPTGESVLVGQIKLGVGKFCSWTRLP